LAVQQSGAYFTMTATIFPSRWSPQHPDQIQLYSLATPNGQKVGVMLEELSLPYEAHQENRHQQSVSWDYRQIDNYKIDI